MRWQTHQLGGAAAWLGACAPLHPAALTLAGGTVIAALSAPGCDIDVSTSKIARAHRWAWRVVRLAGRHREGPCHSLLTAAFAGLAAMIPVGWIAAWPLWAGLAVFTGLASHILLDGFTESPVRMLWPAPWLIHLAWPSWLRCRVGGLGELAWRVLLTAGLVWLAWHAITGARP